MRVHRHLMLLSSGLGTAALARPSPLPRLSFSLFYFLAALHFAFNANPMLTSAMLLEKEKARAERAAGKAKGSKTK